jgi:hypothetical protein
MSDEVDEIEDDAEDRELDEDEDDAPDVPRRIAGRLVELEQLKLLSERWDIMAAYRPSRPTHRVEAAALGLAWPRLRRRLPKYSGDVLEYGGQVLDLLLNAKTPASFIEIRAAGIRAVSLVLTDLVATADGVKEAEDF